jgi:hypothetical protein
MKRAAVPVAMLAAGAMAQELTTTITYSVCPTATTTTITLPTTITYCPGGFCNVTPTGAIGGTVTTTATTTSYITVYPAPCPHKDGLCDASYTIWESCPCTEHGEGYIPADFTTTLHKCNTCGKGGKPTDYTITVPCSTGAYATVTPSYGGDWKPGPHPEIPIDSDGKWSDASDPVAAAEGGAPAADWSDAGKGAAPVADAKGGAPAAPVADASKGWSDNSADPVADATKGWSDNGAAPSGSPASPVAPADASKTGEWSDATPSDYTGSANKAALALSTVFAGVVGALAMML